MELSQGAAVCREPLAERGGLSHEMMIIMEVLQQLTIRKATAEELNGQSSMHSRAAGM